LDRTALAVMPPRNRLADLQIKYVSVLKCGARWLDGHDRKAAVGVQPRAIMGFAADPDRALRWVAGWRNVVRCRCPSLC
jgi:hypothetical protein